MFKRRASRTSWGFDLLEALRPDRCAMCTLALRSVDRYLQGLSYESTNDPAVREQFVRGGGFCRDHAWRYADRWRDGLSVALLYRHLLVQAQRDGQLQVGHDCPACRRRAEAERDLAAIFRAELAREDFRRAASGAMLCRPHAQLVLDRADPGVRQIATGCAERGLAQPAGVAGAKDLAGPLTLTDTRHQRSDAPEPAAASALSSAELPAESGNVESESVTVDANQPGLRPHEPFISAGQTHSRGTSGGSAGETWGCTVCAAAASPAGEPDWAALCNAHAHDRLACGEASPPGLAAGGRGAWPAGPTAGARGTRHSGREAGAAQPCPDCLRELALASAPGEGRRCLNHVRCHGEAWRAATGWVPEVVERLEAYIARQDYRHLAEAEGPEGAQWVALYWTVGATRSTVVDDLLPRLGLSSRNLDNY